VNSSKKLLITLLLGLCVMCNATQAMEQNSELYDEKGEMSFLMQAIQEKEPSALETMVVEEKVAVKAIHDYVCSRHGCRYSTTHENRITKHREMHRLQNAFLSAKIHRCETCDYLTDTPKSMNDHKKSHGDERPYHCDSCDVRFKCPRSRDRHEKTQHKKQIPAKQTLVKPLLVTNNGR
jgi:hypothetical protein